MDGQIAAIQELELVLNAARFRRSPGLCTLFRWLVEQDLNGRAHLLNEHDIARLVFGLQDHDPSSNSRVRRQMSRLRDALAEYYGHEGAKRTVCFEIPEGYQPRVTPRAFSRYSSLTGPGPDRRLVRLLPFSTTEGDLEAHVAPLRLEFEFALARDRRCKLVAASRSPARPDVTLRSIVSRYAGRVFVFAHAQNQAGVVVESARAELADCAYPSCVRQLLQQFNPTLFEV